MILPFHVYMHETFSKANQYLVPGCGLKAAMMGWRKAQMMLARPTAGCGFELTPSNGSRPSTASITIRLISVSMTAETIKPWWHRNQKSLPQGFTEVCMVRKYVNFLNILLMPFSYIQKCFAQLFSNYSWDLWLFGKRISAKKLLVNQSLKFIVHLFYE